MLELIANLNLGLWQNSVSMLLYENIYIIQFSLIYSSVAHASSFCEP